MSVKRGLLMGRFQPFHLGHLQVVRHILGEQDEIILGIGSAQQFGTAWNPFSAGERLLMIIDSLMAADLPGEFYVIPVEDRPDCTEWLSHVEALAPRFQTIYSGSSRVREISHLFKDAGYTYVDLPEFDREKYMGTRIRTLMAQGEAWQELVPKQVVEAIGEIDGVDRLKALNKRKDKP